MTSKKLNQICNSMVKYMQRGGNKTLATIYAQNKGVAIQQSLKLTEIALYDVKQN